MKEAECERFIDAVTRAPVVRLSVAGYIEAALYVERRGDEVRKAMLDTYLEGFSIRLEPVTVEQARMARQAYRSFGKGLHPAALNFGDCFTYALAKAVRAPVLFKGSDFAQTDLEAALPGEAVN